MDTSALPIPPCDRHRLGVSFQIRRRSRAIPQDKIEASLIEHGAGWIWLHLGLADTRCRNWIAQRAPISNLARQVLAGPDRHLRLDILGHEIVAYYRTCIRNSRSQVKILCVCVLS